MSVSLRAPGVYFDWEQRTEQFAAQAITTDVAGFVGIAARGPLFEPVRIKSWTDFVSTFGGEIPQGYLAYAVAGFFANGGRTCWVVRVADRRLARPAALALPNEEGEAMATLEARSTGVWGHDIAVAYFPRGLDRFDLAVSRQGREQEFWRNLSFDETREALREAPEDIPINRHSRLVVLKPAWALAFDWADKWGSDSAELARFVPPAIGLGIAEKLKRAEAARRFRHGRENAFLRGGVDGLASGAVIYPRHIAPTPAWQVIERSLREGIGDLDSGDLEVIWAYLRGEEVRLSPEKHDLLADFVRDRLNELDREHRDVLRREVLRKKVPSDAEALTPDSIFEAARRIYQELARPSLYIALASPEIRSPQVGVSVRIEEADHDDRDGVFELSVLGDGMQLEPPWTVSMDPHSPDYVEYRLNDPARGSRFVRARDLHARPDWRMNIPRDDTYALTGGLTPDVIKDGLAVLESLPEISIVAVPDIMPKISRRIYRPAGPADQPRVSATRSIDELIDDRIPPPAFTTLEIEDLQRAQLAQCAKLGDRVAILDAPAEVPETETAREDVPTLMALPGEATGASRTIDPTLFGPNAILDWRSRFAGTDSTFGAIYFPWVKVRDPSRSDGTPRMIPPSGHIAGAFARTDLAHGVHRAPANTELVGVIDLPVEVGEATYGDLNQAGINLLRPTHWRGFRIGGARSLSPGHPIWRYINVRRLALMIQQTILVQTRWTVFEPNDQALWLALDRVARSFLIDLWERDMLDGATADEAFFVRCDETTNPPEVIGQGRVECLIGLRLPSPVEFITFRIGRTEDKVEIME